jgi:hypothetical protein
MTRGKGSHLYNSPTFRVSVPDLQTASLLLDALAQYDLFQLKHWVKSDYANAGGLEIFEDGWRDWESDDCDDFDTVRDDPKLFASAIEAHRAETAETGSVHESAGPKDDAQGGQP